MHWIRVVVVMCAWVGLAIPSEAQIANPSALLFTSADHAAVVPAGQVGAGSPKVAQYQGILFAAADNVATAVPLPFGTGLVIAKTLATAIPATTPPDYRLTFAQMGLTLPACTVLPCPFYTLVLVAIGPAGTTAREVAAESPPFTAAVPVPPTLHAGPRNLRPI